MVERTGSNSFQPGTSGSPSSRVRSYMRQFCPSSITKDVREFYTIGQEVGKGAFSVVNECFHKTTGEAYAVKTILKDKLSECKQVENEIWVLLRCNHPNVARLYEIYETDDNLFLVMDLFRGGDLHTEVTTNGNFSEQKAHTVFTQLFTAIKYLHGNNIVHRDLKLENILLKRSDEHLLLKVSDFGLSKILRPSNVEFMKTRCGTPAYVAPEILLGENYTSSVDIWSLGVVLYVIVFGQYPFESPHLHEMYEKIISGQIDFPFRISRDLEDIIRGMLTVDPAERLSIVSIANHPWLKNVPAVPAKPSPPKTDSSLHTCHHSCHTDAEEDTSSRSEDYVQTLGVCSS